MLTNRHRIVIFLGFAILASLLYGLFLVRIYLPRMPLAIALCLWAGMFTTWKGKYASSITIAELVIATCMAGSSVVLNMGIPPGGRAVWAWLLAISAIMFASLGTTIPALYARNREAWKNRNVKATG